jgi:MacB-like periplasmic core domain
VLGARPAAGRLFDENDREPVVVISHRFWTRRFQKDPSSIGQAVQLSGTARTVTGVAPEGFHGTTSAIQPLDRLDSVLPMFTGRAERHGFEYYRHGTLSLYAALDPRTGTVVGQTAARHTSADFAQFLTTVVATQAARRANKSRMQS